MIEIGQQGISFIVREGESFFSTVVCYHFDSNSAVHEQLQTILGTETLITENFSKIDICWAFAESILTPHEYFNTTVAAEMIQLVYGDAVPAEIRTDFLFRHNVHNVYSVSVAITQQVATKFPYSNQSHLYSLLPDMLEKKGKQLLAIFYPKHLIAVLVIEGNIQVVQSFGYDNGKDAAYYLLNICQQFNSAPGETMVRLSGMIDERSNLYSELYKYFLHMEFEGLPENFTYADEIKEQPHQFFSHLFATAACV